MRRVMETMARDMALWENGGVEGHLARRGRVTLSTVLNLVIAAISGADFRADFRLSPAVPLSLSIVAACMTLVPSVCPPASDETIKRRERIAEAQAQAFYDANELLEAIELALDADDPSQFPLPNPYNIPLVPTSLMAVQVNRLFHKIKDVCHVESGREGEFANG